MTPERAASSEIHPFSYSAEVHDRLRRRRVALAVIFIDQVSVGGRQPGEAEHLPRNLVAVAAIEGIGEETLHGDGQQALEESPRAEIREFRFALLHCLERGNAIGRSEMIEILAVALARPCVRGGDPGGKI